MGRTPDDLDVDALWAGLGALPVHDIGAERADRIRRTAKAALPRRSSQRAQPSPWSALYRRVLEPAWVTSVAALQIGLVIERLAQIYGG